MKIARAVVYELAGRYIGINVIVERSKLNRAVIARYGNPAAADDDNVVDNDINRDNLRI